MKPAYVFHFWTPDLLVITCYTRYENEEHFEEIALLKRDGSVVLAELYSDGWKDWDEDRRIDFINLAEVWESFPSFSEAVQYSRTYFATTPPAGPEWFPPVKEEAAVI